MTLTHDSFKINPKPYEGELGKIFINGETNAKLSDEFMEFLSLYSEGFSKVALQKFCYQNALKILKNFKNIQGLFLNEISIRDDEKNLPIELPNLKRLEVNKSTKVLQLIRTHDLETLSAGAFCHYRELLDKKIKFDEHFLIIKEFVASNEMIKDLTLSKVVFDREIGSYVKLERLAIDNCPVSDKILLELLKSQKDTLKELSLSFAQLKKVAIPKSLTFLLAEMKLEYIEASILRMDIKVKNSTIKTFTYLNEPKLSRLKKGKYCISSALPNLENLNFYEFSHNEKYHKNLQKMSKGCPNIKSLRLDMLPDAAVIFKNLTHLEIDSIFSSFLKDKTKQNNLLQMIASAEKLTSLKINSIALRHYNDEFLIEVIKAGKSLEEIHFGICKTFSNNLIEFVKNSKNNLKAVSYMENPSTNNKLPNVFSYKPYDYFKRSTHAQVSSRLIYLM